MLDALYSIDKGIFVFLNETIANPFFDAVMPPVTDWNKHWEGIALFAALWLLLFWKGGKRGRIAALLLIPLIVISDQLSSALIKGIVARPRPCHIIGGATVVEHVHLPPGFSCGGGYSFPSSHAVNNFAAATFLANVYRRWSWALYSYAGIMGFSRISVGVHYPSDVAGGAVIGSAVALVVAYAWKSVEERYRPR